MQVYDDEANAKPEMGTVEVALSTFLESEYEECVAICERPHEAWAHIRDMAAGTFIRNPTDPSPLARMYIPAVGLAVSRRAALICQRVVPDSQSMDFLDIAVAKKPDEEFLTMMKDRYGLPAPEEVPAYMGKVLTVGIRTELAKSDFVKKLKDGVIDLLETGNMIAFLEPKFNVELIAEDEIDAVGEDEEAIVVEGVNKYRRPVYAGVAFTMVNPMNIVVGDLECDEGIQGLPFFYVYQTNTLTNMRALRKRAGGGGVYQNLEGLTYRDQSDNPTILEQREGLDTFEDNEAKAQGNFSFQVPIRIGKIDWAAVFPDENNQPSKAEWQEFKEKWGLNDGHLDSNQEWVLEFTRDTPTIRVVRVEPYAFSREEIGQSIAVHARLHKRSGYTFGLGVYSRGGADLEVKYNDTLQNMFEAIQQISAPMWAMPRGVVDNKWLQDNDGSITYIPGQIIPINGNAAGTRLLDPIAPDSMASDKAYQGVQFILEQIRTLVATPPAMYGESGSDSATEAANQSSYLEQDLFSDQTVVENEIVVPLLRKFIATFVQLVKDEVITEMYINPANVQKIFREHTGADKGMYLDISSDEVAYGYEVTIRTAGQRADKQTQMTRSQQLWQQITGAQQMGLLGAKIPNANGYFRWVAEAMDLPSDFIIDSSEDLSVQESIQRAQMMAQSKPTGGAGQSRPDYQRTAAEVPAAGEPMPGMAQGALQMENAGVDVGQGMLV